MTNYRGKAAGVVVCEPRELTEEVRFLVRIGSCSHTCALDFAARDFRDQVRSSTEKALMVVGSTIRAPCESSPSIEIELTLETGDLVLFEVTREDIGKLVGLVHNKGTPMRLPAHNVREAVLLYTEEHVVELDREGEVGAGAYRLKVEVCRSRNVSQIMVVVLDGDGRPGLPLV